MKSINLALVAVAAMNLAACATIVRGTDQQVSVNTDPVGATVRFSTGESCTGPCTIKAKRNQSLQINVSKSGCATQTATMVPTLAGAGVILGGLVDYGTGAVYDLQPNPLTVTLACGSLAQAGFAPVAAAPAPAPVAAPAPAATPQRADTGPKRTRDGEILIQGR